MVKERLMRPVLNDGLGTTIRKVQQSKRLDDETTYLAALALLYAISSKADILGESLFRALKAHLVNWENAGPGKVKLFAKVGF